MGAILGVDTAEDRMADAHLMRTIHPGATGIRAGNTQSNPYQVGIEASPITSMDAAVVFSTEMECMNTRSSTIWREHADREGSGQQCWKDQYRKFNPQVKSRPRQRDTETAFGKSPFAGESIQKYTMGSSMRDPKHNRMLGTKIPDPMPEKKALPRELILNGIFFDNKVKTTPPRLFEHGYNKGCYAPYKATHNHLLPEHNSMSGGHNTHQLVQVSPVTRPAGGSIVTMRGTSDLTPSRFCRKNASKAWSSWLAPTGNNNRFTTLQSSTQDTTQDRPELWSIKPNGRHAARAHMEKASIERAKKGTHGFKEKVHCGIKILNAPTKPTPRPSSTTPHNTATPLASGRAQSVLDERSLMKQASGYMYTSVDQNNASFAMR